MSKAKQVDITPHTNNSIVAASSVDPVFAAIEAHAKASDALWAIHEESLAVGPENAGHLPIQATLVAELGAANVLIKTAPTTHAGLRALEAHLRDDRHNSARGFIGVPCGNGFAGCLVAPENQKSVDWLIAKRGAEIDSAA